MAGNKLTDLVETAAAAEPVVVPAGFEPLTQQQITTDSIVTGYLYSGYLVWLHEDEDVPAGAMALYVRTAPDA